MKHSKQKATGKGTAVFKSTFFLAMMFSLVAPAQAPKDSLKQKGDTVFIYETRGKIVTPATVIDGDTIPWGVLDEVLVSSTSTEDDLMARRRYYILQRKVMRVYPYAVEAGNRLDSLNLRLDKIKSKRKRKKEIKSYQKFLEERFTPELKELTRSEGQILSKLIHRETGVTTYELISTYRSGWNAFWYNVTANWYDISLKKPYEPDVNDDDYFIETILQRLFQQGKLKERVPFYPPQGQEERKPLHLE